MIHHRHEGFASVGRCIYCGDTAGPFSREHIIAKGLGGDLILPESSCERCRKATSKFERACLRLLIGPARYRLNLGKKGNKDRARDSKLTVVYKDGREEIEEVAPEHYPLVVLLPVLYPPGIFDGLPRSRELRYPCWWGNKFDFNPSPHEIEKGISGYRRYTGFAFDNFMRMLAKIGHAYCVATMQAGTFEPLLNDYICHGSRKFSNLIGGYPPNVVGTKPYDISIHTALWGAQKFLVVNVQLFANLGGPGYSIVAAKIRESGYTGGCVTVVQTVSLR